MMMTEELKELKSLTKTLVVKDEQLHEQTDNWKYILNSVPELIFITNLEGTITYINHSMREKLESSNIISAEELPCFIELIEACKMDTPKCMGEVYLSKLDNWYDHTVSIVFNAAGAAIGFVCMLRDIQEHKLAEIKTLNYEKALVESEKRYRYLYENAPMAYQSLDENGCIVEVNLAWQSLLGYTKDEVIGKSIKEIVCSEYLEQFKEKFPELKKKGEIKNLNFKMKRKDGSKVEVCVNGTISKNLDGSFKQTHCILNVVTPPILKKIKK